MTDLGSEMVNRLPCHFSSFHIRCFLLLFFPHPVRPPRRNLKSKRRQPPTQAAGAEGGVVLEFEDLCPQPTRGVALGWALGDGSWELWELTKMWSSEGEGEKKVRAGSLHASLMLTAANQRRSRAWRPGAATFCVPE